MDKKMAIIYKFFNIHSILKPKEADMFSNIDDDDKKYYDQFKNENMEKNKSKICGRYINALLEYEKDILEDYTESEIYIALKNCEIDVDTEQKYENSLRAFVNSNEIIWDIFKENYQDFCEEQARDGSLSYDFYEPPIEATEIKEKMIDLIILAIKNDDQISNQQNLPQP